MNIMIGTVGILIFLYTLGYGVVLFKLGNRFGGVATCILSAGVAVAPFVIIKVFR